MRTFCIFLVVKSLPKVRWPKHVQIWSCRFAISVMFVHISPMCKSLRQSFYLRPLEMTCISAVINSYAIYRFTITNQTVVVCGKRYTFEESDIHLSKGIYICGKGFTFVERDLHLWKGIYICEKWFTFVDWYLFVQIMIHKYKMHAVCSQYIWHDIDPVLLSQGDSAARLHIVTTFSQ